MFLPLLVGSAALAADITVPGDQPDIPAALAAANDGDRILLAAQTYNGTFNVDLEVQIIGAGVGSTLLQSNNGDLIDVNAYGSLTLSDVTLTTNLTGKCIDNAGTLLLTDAELTDCGEVDSGNGGALHSPSGSETTVLRTTFTDNRASRGSHVYAWGDTLLMEEVTLTGGDSDREGAMHITGDVVFTLRDALIENNTCDDDGGALSLTTSGSVLIERTEMRDNVAASSGGAIFMHSVAGGVTIRDSLLIGNSAGRGAGIDATGSNGLTIESTRMCFNAMTSGAGGGGGAMRLYTTEPAVLDGVYLFGNTTGGNGSALLLTTNDATLRNVTLVGHDNRAIHVGGNSSVVVDDSIITGVTGGGGVYSSNAGVYSGSGNVWFDNSPDHLAGALSNADLASGDQVDVDPALQSVGGCEGDAPWPELGSPAVGIGAWAGNHPICTLQTMYTDADGDGIGAGPGTRACAGTPGLVVNTGDCDDSDPMAYPGAIEICDGIDNDCDGTADDGASADTYYDDDDGDGFGQDATGQSSCTPLPGVTVGGDCDDTIGSGASIFPGAPEQCNGIDDDCDGSADFGGGGQEVDADADGFLRCENDCNDLNDTVHPGAPELCDGLDNDCDNNGVADDTEIDDDGDSLAECEGDCDDGEPFAYPGNPEVCDGLDNDCLAGPDDGLPTADYWLDPDGDGWGSGASTNACAQPSGSAAQDGDCDETDASIHPAATESCNGIDDDCDGQVDDGTSVQAWYADGDGDGFGAGVSTGMDCQPPNAGDVTDTTDCDDSNALVSPGAAEICNGTDDDCNGQADDGLAVDPYWPDADADGYGDSAATPSMACGPAPGEVADGTDCDDSDATIHPAAPEICDGLDNDCDTLVDTDDGLTAQPFYADTDGDGYGAGTATLDCQPPPGTVTNDQDCAPADPAINPAALEICDGLDNDCDGLVDADDGLTALDWWDDADGDGYGALGPPGGSDCAIPSGATDVTGDCNDADATVFPTAIEQCDGLDNDCDGPIDEGAVDVDWFEDSDGDGFGGALAATSCLQPSGTVIDDTDCDDSDGAVNPAAEEQCTGVDDDCDGLVDEADDSLVGTLFYPDVDDDGFGDASDPGVALCAPLEGWVPDRRDCADGDPAINPAAVEACPDSIDNDCDGLIDAADPGYINDPVIFWFDQDGDGFGTPSLTFEACSGQAPTGYVPTSAGLDCDDGEYLANPQGTEACDGIDNDCDGAVDDGLAASTWWPDADGDGFGDLAATPLTACDALVPVGWVEMDGDCDDGMASVNPDATEVCDDGVDNDCVGGDEPPLEQWFDQDGDGYGSAALTVTSCETLSGHVDNADDCDDAAGLVYPGATEVCDAVDNDCDGLIDDADDDVPYEDEASGATLYFLDEDDDGFGVDDPATNELACEPPQGFAEASGDCDPNDATRWDAPDCVPPPPPPRSGCSCDTPSGAGSLPGLLTLLLLARRRRAA